MLLCKLKRRKYIADGEILCLNQYIQEAEAKSENEKREKKKIRLQEQREEELSLFREMQAGTTS